MSQLKLGSHLLASTVDKFEILLNLLYPKKAQRDDLYINGINPVVSFPDKAHLFGDDFALGQVRLIELMFVDCLLFLRKRLPQRLSSASLNSTIHSPEPQFKNLIEPFLLDVQSRRGLIDFKVICDETTIPRGH